MNTVERIKELCKERNVKLYRLEKELGFANGYIGQLKKGTVPADRLKKIADYLDVSTDYLLTGVPDDLVAKNMEAFNALVDYVDGLEEEIINEMRKMDNVGLEMMLKYAQFINSTK